MKKRKKLILIISVFAVVLFIILNIFYMNRKYLFVIQDISCDCIPNKVYFYSNKTYVVKKGAGIIIKKGKYKSDPEILIKELTSDNKKGINYEVELYNGEKYYIGDDNKKVNEFLEDLDIIWY